jgi:hypothetical protein
LKNGIFDWKFSGRSVSGNPTSEDLATRIGCILAIRILEQRMRRHTSWCTVLGIILLAATAGSQTAPKPNAIDGVHYPRVLRADIPVYPPLAWELQLTGTVEIQVVVEDGAVVSADVKSAVLRLPKVVLTEEGKKKLPYLSNSSLANVKTWQFEKEDRATFSVKYVYQIEGEPVPERGHPIIELDLPLLVRVTAQPVKYEPLHDLNSR